MTQHRLTNKSCSLSVRTHPAVGRAERRFYTWRAMCCWEASGWAACLLLPGWTASVKKANPLTDKLINILRSSCLKGENIKTKISPLQKLNKTNPLYLLLKHRLLLLEAHYLRLLTLKKYSMCARCWNTHDRGVMRQLAYVLFDNWVSSKVGVKARLRSKAAVPHWAKGQRPFRTKG